MLDWITTFTFLVFFCQGSIVQYIWGRRQCSKSFCIYSEIPSFNAASRFLEVRHPFLGYRLWTRHRNADAALARPWALTITPTCWSAVCHLSQEHQAGGLLAPSIRPWVGETKSAWQEMGVGGWGKGGSRSKHYETSCSLMQMRWRGQEDKTTCRKRWTQRGGWGGIWPPKAALLLWKSQQKWLSIKSSVLTMLVHNK